tara:strand:+ start:241 stop:1029 length:789 start_codon:yes stop_codon:yes gene_type:complete
MKLTKSVLREIIQEVFNEEEEDQEDGRINMDDPVMQTTGWYKDNPELTVGGVLKQGGKHPGYKDALKIVGKEKDKGGEDKPEPKQTKISSNPFDKDDKDEKPSGDEEPFDSGGPSYANVPKGAKTSKQAKDMKSKEKPRYSKGKPSAQINNYVQHMDGGGSLSDKDSEHLKDVFSDVLQQKYGIVQRDEKFGTEDYDSETDDVIFKPLDDERVNQLIGKATQHTDNEIGMIRDKMKKEESITSELKREFKEYDLYNKNMRKI